MRGHTKTYAPDDTFAFPWFRFCGNSVPYVTNTRRPVAVRSKSFSERFSSRLPGLRDICIFSFIGQADYNPFNGTRGGEAKNPGPEHHKELDIGTFNPTQLLNKEDDILQWGRGIYTASETSVTHVAHQILSSKFRKAGWYSRWSQLVEPQQPRTSLIRGKASGTAILSTYPLKPYIEPCPEALRNTERFCDAIAQIHCNTNLYISVMYGFPIANAYLDALQMNNCLFSPIAERANNFQGPAIITGDFNCDLKDLDTSKSRLVGRSNARQLPL